MIELLLQAERALSVGLLDRAETLYRQVARADPRNSIAVVGLARVTLDRGDDEGALELARRALEIDPENVAAQRLIARLEEVIDYRVDADAEIASVVLAPQAAAEVVAGPGIEVAGESEIAAEPEALEVPAGAQFAPGGDVAGESETAAVAEAAEVEPTSTELEATVESAAGPAEAAEPDVPAPTETEAEPVTEAAVGAAAEEAAVGAAAEEAVVAPPEAATEDLAEPRLEPIGKLDASWEPPRPRRRSFLDWLFRRR